jgi:hypothetical protein
MLHKPYVYAAVAAGLTITAALAVALPSSQVFRIRDDCDPKTFNAAPPDGPGLGELCVPTYDGGTTFAEFIEELQEDQVVGAWRFNPDEVRLDRQQGTILESRSGEVHTFTRVAQFGGGVVPDLNVLSNAGPPRQECFEAPSATNIIVQPGAAFAGPTAGRQCCIHPWMKSEIDVR